MNKRHKHYDAIVAWAEGKEIQFDMKDGDGWRDWEIERSPPFNEKTKYRIKPEPKPDLVREIFMHKSGWSILLNPNLRLTFSGEDGKLKKAEVIE